MKRYLIIIFILSTTISFGQAPQFFNYQGAARNNDGTILGDKAIALKINIKNGSITGTNIYSEIHNVTTSSLGLFSLAVGNGSVESGDFSSIDWGGGSKFLNVAVDIDGGNNFIEMGTSQLLSTPYALYAETAGNGGSGSSVWKDSTNNVFFNGKHVSIGTDQYFSHEPTIISTEQDIYTTIEDESYLISTALSVKHNIEYKYDSSHVNPGIRLINEKNQPHENASIGIELLTKNKNNTSFGSVSLTSINAGENKADFAIQVEKGGLRGTPQCMHEVVRFKHDGNVGIGTDSPNERLSVAGIIETTTGGVKFPDGTVQTTATTSPSQIWNETERNINFTDKQVLIRTNDPSTSVPLVIYSNNSTYGTEGGSEAYLLSTAALIKHDIDYTYDSSKVSPGMRIQNDARQSLDNSSVCLELLTEEGIAGNSSGKGAVTLTNINKGSNKADFAIQVENGSTGGGSKAMHEVLRITSEENVGIGTSQPTSKLEVAQGDIYLSDVTSGVIMTSPNGFCFKMTVSDAGTPEFNAITCP